MTRRTITTVEVPLDDFVHCNKGMFRLLLVLYKEGGELSTTKLYDVASTSNNYSHVVLRKAERLGFITRKRIPKPKGEKGNDMVVNSLTTKGRYLLKQLMELGIGSDSKNGRSSI